MKSNAVIDYLERDFSPALAESWDNTGLQLGRSDKEIKRICVALDVTEEVIKEAVAKEADMLLTHHPLLFKGIKRICDKDFMGRRILSLIQADMVCYAMHTNYDVCRMAELSSEKLLLKDTEVLEVTGEEKLYKFVVYTPKGYEETVREAICRAGAGCIGNYSDCTFRTPGTGTFLPGPKTNPFLGSLGELSQAEEYRLETVVPEKMLSKVIAAMKEAHPYEEPAYDVFLLSIEGRKVGIGRTGFLQESMTVNEQAEFVKKQFGLEQVSVCGSLSDEVSRVSVSTGSGKSMIGAALSQGAQVLVTGDIDHHTALDARAAGLTIIDAGHFGTEKMFMEDMKEYIRTHFSDIEVFCAGQRNTFCYL